MEGEEKGRDGGGGERRRDGRGERRRDGGGEGRRDDGERRDGEEWKLRPPMEHW